MFLLVCLVSDHQSGKMENLSRNVTDESCENRLGYLVSLSLIDIIPFLVGQPVIAKLLWLTVTSKKTTDILNCNLALFHNFQYLTSLLHLIVLWFWPNAHTKILKFLLIYTQIGGPMNLFFICLERYVAVIYPTSYTLLTKYRCRQVCAVTVWLLSLPPALLSVLAGEVVSTIREKVLRIIPFHVFMIMTAMIVRCTFGIARMLTKSGTQREKLHPVKKRAFKTICATSTIVLFCHIPVTLMQLLKFTDEYTYDCIITPVGILLLFFASVVHPLFYLSTQGKFFTCLKWKK